MRRTKPTIPTMENYSGNANSRVNQDIKSRFVAIHVHACVSSMVEYILKKSYEDREAPFDIDDVENLYSCPEYHGNYASFDGGTEAERDAEVQRLRDLIEDTEDFSVHNEAEIETEIDKLEELETEAQEVYEWWLISSFLLDKLKALGHPVLDAEGIWGRCTSGQAILLDHAISEVCAGMGILDGQEYSWAKKD